MQNLSPTTWKIVQQMFRVEEHVQVGRILKDECGTNLPLSGNADMFRLERIRFAVLKLSDADLSELRRHIDEANKDWRDVLARWGVSGRVARRCRPRCRWLMAAGFAESLSAHEDWAHEMLDRT